MYSYDKEQETLRTVNVKVWDVL